MTTGETWVKRERDKVLAYLPGNVDQHGRVADVPAFQVEPYFAIWAVESTKQDNRTAFWVFSGDISTDVAERDWADPDDNPRKALVRILAQWASYIPDLEQGRSPPEVTFQGGAEELKVLAEAFRSRLRLLGSWAEDDENWGEDCPLDT